MLLLTCPHCGLDVEETELAPGGEAHLERHGPDSSDGAFEEYLFLRRNVRGVHLERWRHAYGCGKWFVAARDTVTMQGPRDLPGADQGPAARDRRAHPRRGRAMSRRLPLGGTRIDRTRPLEFTFDGRPMRGYEGDTLASALLGAGQLVMGRSFKYHRPRSVVASGPEEPNALLGIGAGARFEPNRRATSQDLVAGLEARSQNAWPSLGFDVGRVNDWGARFLPAGFYYKTFIHPRPLWKHLFEPFIRRAAGLGAAPTEPDADAYEHRYAYCDTLVVGGGIAGLVAALGAGAAGERVMLVEREGHWGGRSLVDGAVIDGRPAADWVKDALQRLDRMDNVTVVDRCEGSGVYDHGYVLCTQSLTDHRRDPTGPRQRLWKVRAGRIVAATGAIERPLSFAGNDVPGVMLASAVRDYVSAYGVAPAERTVIVTNNDDAYRTARILVGAGLRVVAIVDARAEVGAALLNEIRGLGIVVHVGRGIAKVHGDARVTGVTICHQRGGGAPLQEIRCDGVAMSGGWSPVVHLWSHCGGKLWWDEARAMFRPDPDHPPTGADGQGFVTCIGAASGARTAAEVLADAAEAVGVEPPDCEAVEEGPIAPVWIMPEGAPHALRSKAWLDFQNDVKVSDVRLAAQEGFESVEHAKRYTTLGMATDQGKLSNVNGLAVLADRLDMTIPEVGTTTFRPPYTPVTIGALAGEGRGAVFQPLRRTPMHDWHVARGAYMEPVGQWRRPYCYPAPGEDHAAAVAREIGQTRGRVGLLDASTLGKLLVRGPDAGRFVDMLYTNMMSTLAQGKCRYGLMCDENGFLIDDGVVARIDETTWLCHTTTGGADRIHAWMEDWLQCEWWDWRVHVVNLTEQLAQVAVVGPKARARARDDGRHGRLRAGAAVHALGGRDARRVRPARLPHQLLGRAQLRAGRARRPRPCALGGADGGGRGARDRALRDRGAARDARGEGVHHDRRRDRRDGRAAGPRPRLGDLEEEGRLSRQAGPGALRVPPPRPLEARRPRDARRIGARGRGLRAGGGAQRERAGAGAGTRDLDLPVAHARSRDRHGAGGAWAAADGRGPAVQPARAGGGRGPDRVAGVPRSRGGARGWLTFAFHPVEIGMVALRGGPDVTGPALRAAGLPDAPERRMSVRAGALAALWMSPDEILVTAPREEVDALAARLTEAIGDSFGMAVEMSAARAVFALSGGDVQTVLSGLMPVDFDRLAPEEVRRTRLAQVPAALWREGDGWRLMCFRSVAVYVEDLLRLGAGQGAARAGG